MRKKAPVLVGCEVLPPLETEAEREREAANARPRPPGKRRSKKSSDRLVVLNAFIDFTMAGLGRSDLAVWLVLYRDTRDGIARTGQADIARRAGVCVRTVRRAIRRLESRRLLQVVWRGRLGTGASRYRVQPVPDPDVRET